MRTLLPGRVRTFAKPFAFFFYRRVFPTGPPSSLFSSPAESSARRLPDLFRQRRSLLNAPQFLKLLFAGF